MDQLGTILTVLLALDALGTGVFLILENRRPQATLAWMLVFIFAPGIGCWSIVCSGGMSNLQQTESTPPAGSRGQCPSHSLADAITPGRGDRQTRGRQCRPQKAHETRETQLLFRADEAEPCRDSARRGQILSQPDERCERGTALYPSPVLQGHLNRQGKGGCPGSAAL